MMPRRRWLRAGVLLLLLARVLPTVAAPAGNGLLSACGAATPLSFVVKQARLLPAQLQSQLLQHEARAEAQHGCLCVDQPPAITLHLPELDRLAGSDVAPAILPSAPPQRLARHWPPSRAPPTV